MPTPTGTSGRTTPGRPKRASSAGSLRSRATASATATSCATSTGPSRRSTSASPSPTRPRRGSCPSTHPEIARAARGASEGPALLDGHGRRRLPRRHGGRTGRRGQGSDAADTRSSGARSAASCARTTPTPSWSPSGPDPRTPSTAPSTPTSSTGSTGTTTCTQKESWRILNGYSEGHSFFDSRGQGEHHRLPGDATSSSTRPPAAKGYISLPLGNHDLARLNVKRTDAELEMIMRLRRHHARRALHLLRQRDRHATALRHSPRSKGRYKPRTGARTPMQWTGGREPRLLHGRRLEALPAGGRLRRRSQRGGAAEADPASLLNRVKKLIALKHQEPALSGHADFLPLYAKANTYPLVYTRGTGKDLLLAIFNPAARPEIAEVMLPTPFKKLVLAAGRETKNTEDGTGAEDRGARSDLGALPRAVGAGRQTDAGDWLVAGLRHRSRVQAAESWLRHVLCMEGAKALVSGGSARLGRRVRAAPAQ